MRGEKYEIEISNMGYEMGSVECEYRNMKYKIIKNIYIYKSNSHTISINSIYKKNIIFPCRLVRL